MARVSTQNAMKENVERGVPDIKSINFLDVDETSNACVAVFKQRYAQFQ
jgi:hypothetical protein